MKKFISRLLIFFILSFLFITIAIPAYAGTSKPLDEIQAYEIIITPRKDGTLDMHYTIVWKVLDDKSEGALEWVKIGNPNSHVDEIVGISDNINNIRSYEVDSNTYIRIDLDKEYHKGDVLTIEYSIHQSYMYIVEEDSHLIRYSFTAGWFPEINVKSIKVLWNADNVIEASTEKKENGYYIWEDSLNMDERFNVSVKYNSEVFEYNLDEQYVEGSDGSGDTAFIIAFVILLVLVILLVIIAMFSSYDGGFGGRGGIFISHSSCASGCACASSCACACACAGGGRAGCTKKDFYHTNVKVKELEELLKN